MNSSIWLIIINYQPFSQHTFAALNMSLRKELVDLQIYNRCRKGSRKDLKYLCQRQRKQYFKAQAKSRQKDIRIKQKEKEKLLISQLFPQKSDEIKTSIMDSDSNPPQKHDYMFSLKKIRGQQNEKSLDRSYQYKKDLDVEVFFQPQPPIYYYFKKKQEKQKERQKQKQKEEQIRQKEKQKLRSFPVLHISKDHKQSMFSLQCDQPHLPQHVVKSIHDFQKLVDKLMTRFQNTQIRVPKPTGTYCWVCRSHYQPQDYLTHIKSKYHLQKDKNTQIWKDIKKMVTKVNMQNAKPQYQKIVASTTNTMLMKQSSKALFQQAVQKNKIQKQMKKKEKKEKKAKMTQVQKNSIDNYLKKYSTIYETQKKLSIKQIETIQNQKSRSKSKEKNTLNQKNVKKKQNYPIFNRKEIDFGLEKTRSAQKMKRNKSPQQQEHELSKIQFQMQQLKNQMKNLQKNQELIQEAYNKN